MSFGIVILATISAYLFGFASLLLGHGLLVSLGVVALTGTCVAFGLVVFVVLRDTFAGEADTGVSPSSGECSIR